MLRHSTRAHQRFIHHLAAKNKDEMKWAAKKVADWDFGELRTLGCLADCIVRPAANIAAFTQKLVHPHTVLFAQTASFPATATLWRPAERKVRFSPEGSLHHAALSQICLSLTCTRLAAWLDTFAWFINHE